MKWENSETPEMYGEWQVVSSVKIFLKSCLKLNFATHIVYTQYEEHSKVKDMKFEGACAPLLSPL